MDCGGQFSTKDESEMSTKRGLKRIIRRALEEMRATAEIARYTSAAGGLMTFFVKANIQLLNRRTYRETPADTKWLLKKHEVMRTYFDRRFQNFLTNYDYNRVLPDNDPQLRQRIWICWWQGVDQAPEIVRQCIESVRRHAGGHTVTVITEENYGEYIQIPKWIEEKYRAGTISRTHFSDVLRLCLLAEHGGMWLDATIFCVHPVLEDYFSVPVWSVKRPGYGHISAGCGGFVTGTMQCAYSHRWIFTTIRDFLLHYWQEHDLLVDYLALDYLIDLVQRADPRIAACFDSIVPNNPKGDELLRVLNEPFDAAYWEELKQDTALFILSWKRSFVTQKNNRDTFYAKLLEGTL